MIDSSTPRRGSSATIISIDLSGQPLARGKAGGKGDAVTRLAAKVQARMELLDAGHRFEMTLVSEIVLRDRARPEGVPLKHAGATDTKELAQVGFNRHEELGRGKPRQCRVARAADEDGQRNVPRRRALREQRGREENPQD